MFFGTFSNRDWNASIIRICTGMWRPWQRRRTPSLKPSQKSRAFYTKAISWNAESHLGKMAAKNSEVSFKELRVCPRSRWNIWVETCSCWWGFDNLVCLGDGAIKWNGRGSRLQVSSALMSWNVPGWLCIHNWLRVIRAALCVWVWHHYTISPCSIYIFVYTNTSFDSMHYVFLTRNGNPSRLCFTYRLIVNLLNLGSVFDVRNEQIWDRISVFSIVILSVKAL